MVSGNEEVVDVPVLAHTFLQFAQRTQVVWVGGQESSYSFELRNAF